MDNTPNANKLLLLSLPIDYVEFMNKWDGGVGFIGINNNYIDLWPLNRIIELNPYYPGEEFAEKVIIIGSDGGGTLYGYDLLTKSFFETDVFQMSRDEAVSCGNSFVELLDHVETKTY